MIQAPRLLGVGAGILLAVELRPLSPSDHARAVLLNNDAVPAVNPHDEASFAELIDQADRAWVFDDDGTLAAMLVTFAPGAAYGSRNYGWLSERYDDFRYVDRIIVAPSHKRMGLGASLYAALEEQATAVGAARLLCEVNVEPPNPQSVAFHEDRGWEAIEDHWFADDYAVRFFQKALGDR